MAVGKRSWLRTVGVRIAPRTVEGLTRLRATPAEVEHLKRRVTSLEADLKEAQRATMRLADVIDVVEELLLPATARDEEKLEVMLQQYVRESWGAA